MKITIKLSVALLLLNISLLAQEDKSAKIILNQFFVSPTIECSERGRKFVLYKDSIFAIRMKNGKKYRFINLNPCLIADTSYLYVYTYATTRTKFKMSGPHRRAKEIPATYYYFSFGNHKEPYLLTIDNIRKCFFAQSLVYNTISKIFTSDQMLKETNPQTGCFKLNELLISTMKN
jgi:hypothetical protein